MHDVARPVPCFKEGPIAPRVVRAVFRGLWHGVIPALAAFAAVRYLLPNPNELEGGALSKLSFRLGEHPLEVGAMSFVLFAVLVRCFQDVIPGGRYLSSLPLPLVPLVPPADAAEYEAAVATHRTVRRARERGDLNDPAVANLLEELHASVEAGSTSSVRSAALAVRERGLPALLSAERVEGLKVALAIAGAAVLALVLKSGFVSVYRVEGSSMLPTLRPGDHVAVRVVPRRAWPFGVGTRAPWLPRRGDVVLFADGSGVGPVARVKRVIGLPGDRIKMDGLFPVINGWTVPSCNVGPYASFTAGTRASGRMRVEFLEDRAYLVLFGSTAPEMEGEYTVPQNAVFVLGDDRSESLDSRSMNSGFGGGIDVGLLEGRAERVVYGLHADGSADLEHLLRKLDPEFVLDGVSTSVLKDRIRGCLEKRPKNANPPGPVSAPGSASLSPSEQGAGLR